jgi:conjugative transfer signal peptidase TraF
MAFILAIPLTLLIAASVMRQSGVRLNFSESEPLGFYVMKPFEGQVISRNDLIAFCPALKHEDYPFLLKGDCSGGTMPFLKRVIGLPGDTVKESDQGVWINGKPVASTEPQTRSKTYGTVLRHWAGTQALESGEYWVYGDGDPRDSFDSRYYGPVHARQIVSIRQGVKQ